MARLITRDDIRTWVSRYDAKGHIQVLISRLVRAIAEKDTYIQFPSGSAVFLPGWDGKTNAPTGNEYIPKDWTLWEIGTETNFKAKAQGDYDKRTLKPLGYNSAECTFIFVTPHDWNDKDTWIKEKLAEGKWKDIRIYDVNDIEQWLDLTPAIEKWLSIHLRKVQADGIQSCEDYWHEWSKWQGGELHPEIVTCGRESEAKQLADFLKGPVGIRAVQAASKDEAVAFIVSTILQMEDSDKEKFLSRGLIVEREDVFRSLSHNYANARSLTLISIFENAQGLFRGVSDGHHVIYAMGGDDTFSNEIIVLPMLGRDAHLALEKSGIGSESARDYVIKSGRNLTYLKRLLGFPQNKAEWATLESAPKLIPALLLGRWDESVKGDLEIVNELFESDLEQAHNFFFPLTQSATPFLYNFRTSWRLASPMDAWLNLGPFIKTTDFEKLAELAIRIISEPNPALELEPAKRELANFYGKKWKYSGWIKEGIVQSLILIAVYGDKFHLNHGQVTSKTWVDNVIDKVLGTPDNKVWMSLNTIMPLIAEASPDNFLKNLTLLVNNSNVHELFTEDPSTLSPRTYYTGLLWSLEEVAWLPEYLTHATYLLGKLANSDPGGKLINRPINSLREIYLPWHPHTFASVEERIAAIDELTSNLPEIAWDLILKILPTHHDISHGTAKLRWRLFGFPTAAKNITLEDWNKQVSFFVDKLIALSNYNEDKVASLLEASLSLEMPLRNKVIEFIGDAIGKMVHTSDSLWHKIRTIVPRHREFIEEDWALSDEELKRLEKYYVLLTPKNIEKRTLWIFNDRWPQFIDVFDRSTMSHEEQTKLIEGKKQMAVNELYEEIGLNKIIELFSQVKDQWAFGYSLAMNVKSENDTEKVLSDENLSNDKITQALKGFVFRKNADDGFFWTKGFILKKERAGFSDKSLANILLSIPFCEELFQLIDSLNEKIGAIYWAKADHHTYWLETSQKAYVVEKLKLANRNVAAIDMIYEATDAIPLEMTMETLENAPKVKNNDERILNQYHVQAVLERLSKRDDIDKSRLAKLEWLYLPLLISYSGSTTRIPLLNEELGKEPTFFIELIKLLYRPKISQPEEELLPEDVENKRFWAENAYKLLSAWNYCPGSIPNNEIDKEALWKWVNEVRKMAIDVDRIEVADMHIGQVFAKQNEVNKTQWPVDPICEVIDTLNSDALNRNFMSGVFNKHGSYSKAMFEGGDRERRLSNHYAEFSKKIVYKWPITSALLKKLSDNYLDDAKREDENAARESLDY